MTPIPLREGLTPPNYPAIMSSVSLRRNAYAIRSGQLRRERCPNLVDNEKNAQICQHCDFIGIATIRSVGPHTGAYCTKCGKWIKWLKQ